MKAYIIKDCPSCPNFDYIETKAFSMRMWEMLHSFDKMDRVYMPFNDMKKFGIHENCPLPDFKNRLRI